MEKFTNSTTAVKFRRKISPFERMYVASQKIYPPVANQLVIEGIGEINIQNLQTALGKAGKACPGSQLILKGKYWIDSGKPPPLHEVTVNDFNGHNFSEISRFWHPLDAFTGPTCEVLLIHSKDLPDKNTLVFRSSHGVMDGRGTICWIENVFRALRNEELIAAMAPLNEIELLPKFTTNIQRREIGFRSNSPLSVTPTSNSLLWKRRTIPGTHPAMVAKLAAALTEFTKQDNLNFLVPVDIRRHDPNMHSTACLSLPIFLSTQTGDTWTQIRERLLQQLNKKRELALDGSEWCLSNIPLIILTFWIGVMHLFLKLWKKYPASAVLSNLAKVPLQSFSSENFTPKSMYALPVHTGIIPLFFVTTQCHEHMEILVSCSLDKHVGQEVDKLLDQIITTIS